MLSYCCIRWLKLARMTSDAAMLTVRGMPCLLLGGALRAIRCRTVPPLIHLRG